MANSSDPQYEPSHLDLVLVCEAERIKRTIPTFTLQDSTDCILYIKGSNVCSTRTNTSVTSDRKSSLYISIFITRRNPG